ncbi:hypothetical protein XYCOK13_27950 [Xylanibacillus composti]|uniref:Translational regulator CsrA n=1 Tax=Xylanibacillus composti TaxID=1572762 RepID=A0A8J4H5C9_9BACL|nr:carbon storage regulator CsrA [Xylanibacillus composti]GIQ69971.1 hypothetical protein XYCOK13_27950 [Xylanibacillus composti]
MLVLKRKVGETIVIGEGIEVQVLGIEGESVKIGIDAPKDVQILRKELYDSIREENVRAAVQHLPQEQLQKLLRQQFNHTKTE